MNVQKDYEELFELLNQEKVKYLIVGAHAVAFHAQPRFTGDIDIFVEASSQNAKRILKVFEQFGFGNVGVSQKDFEKPKQVVQLGKPPVRIDFITEIEGINFHTAWRNHSEGRYGKEIVYYISKDDLIKNKVLLGRKQDLFDLELLGY